MSEIQPSVYVPLLGFRFDPTDEELVSHYLCRKINGEDCSGLIEDMDVYSREPWNLSHKNNPAFKENEWFYFVKRSQASGSKNANGKRPKRTIEGDTNGGSWTAIDGDKQVVSETGQIVGYKKTLTFYTNKKRNGKGVKTDWIMKEYRLNSELFQHLVLCKIRHKINRKKQASAQVLNASVPCKTEINDSFRESSGSTLDIGHQPSSSDASGLIASVLDSSASALDIDCHSWSSDASVLEPSSSALDIGCQAWSSDASGLNASVLDSTASELDVVYQPWSSDASGLSASVLEPSASALDIVYQPRSSDASGLNASVLDSTASELDIVYQPWSSDASGLSASVLEPSASALDIVYQPRSSDASGLSASFLEPSSSALDIGCQAWSSDASGLNASVLDPSASELDIIYQPWSSDASGLSASVPDPSASALDIVYQPWSSDASGLSAYFLEPFPSALDIGCQPRSSDASGLNASALDLGCGQMELNDMNLWGTDAGEWFNEIFLLVSEDGEVICG